MKFYQKYKKIITNILWLCSEYILKLISGILVAGLVARQLGVANYGLFQYALTLVTVFSAISFICGASVLVPRLVNANALKRKQLMGNAFILRIMSSFLAYILLLIFSFVTEEYQQFCLTAILGVSILVSEAFAVVIAWLQSQTNNKPRSILVNIATTLKCILISILFYLKVESPLIYAFAWLVEPFIVAFGLVYFYYKITGSLFFTYSRYRLIYLLKQSIPFFGGALAMFLFQRLDIIMLRHLVNEYELGIYATGIQLLNGGVLIFAAILSTSMAPMLIYKHEDMNVIKRNIFLVTTIMLCFAICTAFIGNLFTPWAILTIFGKKYEATIPIFSMQLWASCLFFVDNALSLFFIKMKKGNLLFGKWIIVLLSSTPIYLILIDKYGAYGAVIAYAIGYLIACIISIFFIYRYKKSNSTTKKSYSDAL